MKTMWEMRGAMRYLSSKQLVVCLIPLMFASGCMKVDTDPDPLFCQIQEEISDLTDETIYWDRSLQDSLSCMPIEELLENALTDERAVQIALLNNRQLQGVYESLGIAKAQLAQAGLLKNPIFSFSYRFSTQSSITDLIDGSLIQNVLEILLIPLKKRMAIAELEATKNMIKVQVIDTIAKTRIAFYDLQAKEQIWLLKKKVLLAAELSYEVAQKLFCIGNIIDLKMAMERSTYEQARLDVASVEVEVLEAREKLNVLMGLWGRQIEWKTDSELPAMPEKESDFLNIENEVIANSLDLKVAFDSLLSTAAGFGIDTSRLVFPQFDVGVSTERDDNVWYVGPAFSLALPIFDFGLANSAKAKAKILQQWNQFTALAIDIRSSARIARFSLLNAFRQSQYLEKVIVPLAEQITHSTLLQHNAMQLGVFNLLMTKRSELEKKIQHVHLLQNYWISKVTLEALVFGHVLGKDVFELPLRRHFE